MIDYTTISELPNPYIFQSNLSDNSFNESRNHALCLLFIGLTLLVATGYTIHLIKQNNALKNKTL